MYELDSATCRPSQIITGPDRALWFTRSGDDRIGRITTSGEAIAFRAVRGAPHSESLDLARELGGPIASVAAEAPDRDRLFAGVVDELRVRRGTVVVIEDIQWADEATS